MKLAIVITTYKRNDGRSKKYLTRCLTGIKNQTHQNYKVFLIGDKYEDQEEFDFLASSIIEKDKIFARNLSHAVEREKYQMGSLELWCSGGANARNTGVDDALSEGYSYICHTDHDDYWSADHLEQINRVIEEKKNPAFIFTCSTYVSNGTLPKDITVFDGDIVERFPEPADVIFASTCMDYTQLPLKNRDMYEVTQTAHPSDADLWDRVKIMGLNNNLKSYLVKKLTCFHPTENVSNREECDNDEKNSNMLLWPS